MSDVAGRRKFDEHEGVNRWEYLVTTYCCGVKLFCRKDELVQGEKDGCHESQCVVVRLQAGFIP